MFKVGVKFDIKVNRLHCRVMSDFKISDMDDWMNSEDEDSDEEEGEGEDEEAKEKKAKKKKRMYSSI